MPPRQYPEDYLAKRAATALVMAVATDAWEQIRIQIAMLFGHGEPDTRIIELLAVLEHAAENKSVFEQLDVWTAEFANLLAIDPDAAQELTALVVHVEENYYHRPVSAVPGSSTQPSQSYTDHAATGIAAGQFEAVPSDRDIDLGPGNGSAGGDQTAVTHQPVNVGVYCRNAHLIDPDLMFCPICGTSMSQITLDPVPVAGSPYMPDEDAVSRAVRSAVRPGLLAYNPPAEMTHGRKECIDVGIARSPELREALVKGMQGAVQVEEVPTADYMGVELTGDAFRIKPYGPVEQIVAPQTRWQFDVTPLRPGTQTLTLVVTLSIKQLAPAHLAVKGRIAIPVFQRQIRVHVNIGYETRRFLAGNWQWLVGTIVAAAAALAAWAALVH